MENERVAVVGGRYFRDKDYLYYVLDELNKKYEIAHIISGGATGADALGESWAKTNQIPYTIFPAQWNKFGRPAGFIRNAFIVDACDVLMAFPMKESVGTYHSIELAENSDKKVFILDKYC